MLYFKHRQKSVCNTDKNTQIIPAQREIGPNSGFRTGLFHLLLLSPVSSLSRRKCKLRRWANSLSHPMSEQTMSLRGLKIDLRLLKNLQHLLDFNMLDLFLCFDVVRFQTVFDTASCSKNINCFKRCPKLPKSNHLETFNELSLNPWHTVLIRQNNVYKYVSNKKSHYSNSSVYFRIEG